MKSDISLHYTQSKQKVLNTNTSISQNKNANNKIENLQTEPTIYEHMQQVNKKLDYPQDLNKNNSENKSIPNLLSPKPLSKKSSLKGNTKYRSLTAQNQYDSKSNIINNAEYGSQTHAYFNNTNNNTQTKSNMHLTPNNTTNNNLQNTSTQKSVSQFSVFQYKNHRSYRTKSYYDKQAPQNSEMYNQISNLINKEPRSEFKSVIEHLEDQKLLKNQRFNKYRDSYEDLNEQFKNSEKQKYSLSSAKKKPYSAGKVSNSHTIINPRKIDLKNGVQFNSSKIQKQFVKNYNNLTKKPDQGDNFENKEMVKNLLLSQLSASAISSHKWKNKAAQFRIMKYKPDCTEFSHYPLSPTSSQQMEKLKLQIMKKQEQLSKIQNIDPEEENLEQQLILDTQSDLDCYINNIVNLKKGLQLTYNQKQDVYNDMIEYCKLLDSQVDKKTVSNAYEEINIINTKGKKLKELFLKQQKQLQDQKKKKYLENEQSQEIYNQQQHLQAPNFYDRSILDKLYSTTNNNLSQFKTTNRSFLQNNSSFHNINKTTYCMHKLNLIQEKKQDMNDVLLGGLNENDVFQQNPVLIPRYQFKYKNSNIID